MDIQIVGKEVQVSEQQPVVTEAFTADELANEIATVQRQLSRFDGDVIVAKQRLQDRLVFLQSLPVPPKNGVQ